MAGDASSADFSQDDIDKLFDELTKSGGTPAPKPAGAAKPAPQAAPPATPPPAQPPVAPPKPAAPTAPAKAAGSAPDDLEKLLAAADADQARQQGDAGPAPAGQQVSVSQEEFEALMSNTGVMPAPQGESTAGLPFGTFELPEAPQTAVSLPTQNIDLLRDVTLNVRIELGRANMYVKDVLGLAKGSVVELDKLAGDPLDILVNNRLVAKGEVLVLNDNFCVRITEILSPRARKDQEKE